MHYPSEADRHAIETWDILCREDAVALMARVKQEWNEGYRFDVNGTKYTLATGGWSGHEEVIDSLQVNAMFWACCWESSHRGGLHEFDVATLPVSGA